MTLRAAVSAEALQAVLAALVGPPHLIRELQAMRAFNAIPHKASPIDTLLEEYNDFVNAYNAKPRELDLPAEGRKGSLTVGQRVYWQDSPGKEHLATIIAQHENPFDSHDVLYDAALDSGGSVTGYPRGRFNTAVNSPAVSAESLAPIKPA